MRWINGALLRAMTCGMCGIDPLQKPELRDGSRCEWRRLGWNGEAASPQAGRSQSRAALAAGAHGPCDARWEVWSSQSVSCLPPIAIRELPPQTIARKRPVAYRSCLSASSVQAPRRRRVPWRPTNHAKNPSSARRNMTSSWTN